MASKTHNPERSSWKGRSYKKGGANVKALKVEQVEYEAKVTSAIETAKANLKASGISAPTYVQLESEMFILGLFGSKGEVK